MPHRYIATVIIECDTLDQATTVLAERLGPDEDYGFPYRVSHTETVAVP
jgi:hypothetical protein